MTIDGASRNSQPGFLRLLARSAPDLIPCLVNISNNFVNFLLLIHGFCICSSHHDSLTKQLACLFPCLVTGNLLPLGITMF